MFYKLIDRRKSMKKLLIISVTLLLMFPVFFIYAAGGSKEEATGTVKYYTDNDESELDVFASAISKGTGLKLEPLRMSSGEAWTRVEAEAPNVGADLHFGWPLSFALMAKEKGLLLKYKSPAWKKISAKYKDPDGYWYGWSYWFACIAANKVPGVRAANFFRQPLCRGSQTQCQIS
jgi:iron(III) transport system substrate-binding protein